MIPDATVFVCSSAADAEWLTRLKQQCAPLVQASRVRLWEDTQIAPGVNRRAAIEAVVENARAAVLLVSAAFLADPLIQQEQLPRLLLRAQRDKLPLLPVLLSPCLVEQSPLVGMSFVGAAAPPLNLRPQPEQEAALGHVARALLAALFPDRPLAAWPPLPSSDPQAARHELVRLLTERFRQSERENLLRRLGVHPDDVALRPEDREQFAHATVQHLDHLGRLPDLWDAIAAARPLVLHGRPNPFK